MREPRAVTNITRTICCGVASLLLAACTSSAVIQPQADFEPTCETGAGTMIRALAKRDQATTFLLLSGGGSRGAWGAGFLKAWEDKGGTAQPPQFNVVTGVSTGALQSTFAFLGEYERLEQLYLSATDSRIFKKRFPLFVPFSSSIRKTGPLKELLERELSSDVIRKVAEQGDGRLLCVAAVNLRTGRTVAWDLTEIARRAQSEDDDARRAWESFYRGVIAASAAVPVVFPPVEISKDGVSDLYVDGGTRDNVFVAFSEILDSMVLAAKSAAPTAAVPTGISADVYVLVNGKLGADEDRVKKRIIPVAARSVELLLTENSFGNLFKIESLLDSRFGEGAWSMRTAYISPAFKPECESLSFDAECLLALRNEGRRAGSMEDPWTINPIEPFLLTD